MKKPMKKLMNKPDALVLVADPPVDLPAVSAGASGMPADPEVVATAKRRQFSGSERRRILAAADRCTAPGEIGALLRREGIYSSQLAAWRKKRVASGRAGLDSQKRGRKADPAIATARREETLTRENKRLRHQLTQAHTIIDVQKKLCTLLGLPTAESPDEGF
jgi:transposase-like protein